VDQSNFILPLNNARNATHKPTATSDSTAAQTSNARSAVPSS